jgi:hypothetical protein
VSVVVQCPLWFPLEQSQTLGFVAVPFFTWCCWTYANREAITRSRTSTDPFPDGVL